MMNAEQEVLSTIQAIFEAIENKVSDLAEPTGQSDQRCLYAITTEEFSVAEPVQKSGQRHLCNFAIESDVVAAG